MPNFHVTRSYRAVYRGGMLGFSEGGRVELDEATAAWVNNDSPGCLVPADGEPESGPAEVEVPADGEPRRGRPRRSG